MPRKTYVLDTSALLSNGKRALFAFAEHEVVLPLVVVKELEAKRSDPLIGFVARSVLHTLEDLRNQDGSKHALSKGVKINGDKNGVLRIEVNHVNISTLPESIRSSSHDTRILAVANNLQQSKEQKLKDELKRELNSDEVPEVTLVSNDLPMRILAESSLQIKAEPFRISGIDQGDYKGIDYITVSPDVVSALYDGDSVSADSLDLSNPGYNNAYVLSDGRSSVLAIKRGNVVKKAYYLEKEIFGMRGRNAEQRLALEHLMHENTPVVSLGGPAGTGKTLLALAAGLQQTVENKKYNKVVVFRPVTAVENQNLGFLPGTEEEKMSPWGAAVYDALEAIIQPAAIEELNRSGSLEVLPVTHIRGRTFHNCFIIIDEAQNLERATLLAVLSRLGEGSKAVFSWDASQRDNMHIGRHDGIVPIVDRLKEEKMFAHITLSKTERSAVADMATRVLDDLNL